ncbi:GNAT family N-acetyltransferase [Actinomadura chokoriensis]|uniref:GNAT family N-acetyltransferase n=1 Tax=Actinomadura chokoriensis TaxID=454156 RepID=A0ABV4R0K1_9ACTN
MALIRSTAPADLPCLVAWESDEDTAGWLGETGHAWHARALADPDQDHVVTEHDGVLSGFAVLAGLRTPDRVIELRRLVVAPDLRGKGQGRALLEAVLAHAYDNHLAKEIWLDVKVHNQRAQKLYLSAGFVITQSDGTEPDLIVMLHHRTS